MKAVILAGGEGSRLGGVSREIPKPMVSIGDRPILEHQVLLLKRYGIEQILIIIGCLGHVIEEHFGDGRQFGISISYYREPIPLGTTGGVKDCEHLLAKDFILLYGDIMMDMDLGRFVRFHQAKQADASLLLHPNDHPYDSDLAEINTDARIVAFHAKPHSPDRNYQNLVNAAAYVFSPCILEDIEKGTKADFGRDIFPRIFQKRRLYGYNSPEYAKDVGTPERLDAVNRDYARGKIARLNIENPRAAIFLDRDGVINRHVDLLHRIQDFELLPGVGAALRAINLSDYLAIVVTNQPVVARNLCTTDEVDEIHRKMETLLGSEGAFLNGIYYCPHHPHKGYPGENPTYKVDCDCRKPATGLLKQAAKDFGIDLATSCLIGDTARDISTARNAGIQGLAIRSGADYGDDSVVPDAVFDDLAQAVESVLGRSRSGDDSLRD